MTVPTIDRFNSWSPQDKLFWIHHESDGKYKTYTRSQGYFPFLVYHKQNVGIVYTVNEKGELTDAVAMTVKEAFDRLARFKSAMDAVNLTRRAS